MRIWMQQDATNKLYIIGMAVLTISAPVFDMSGMWYARELPSPYLETLTNCQ